MTQAKELADALGEVQPDEALLQAEIARLRKKTRAAKLAGGLENSLGWNQSRK